jgi:hypothetical protein
MKLKDLKQFEGKLIKKLILLNNFTYTNIVLKISPEGLISFYDNFKAEDISISAEFIMSISVGGNGNEA